MLHAPTLSMATPRTAPAPRFPHSCYWWPRFHTLSLERWCWQNGTWYQVFSFKQHVERASCTELGSTPGPAPITISIAKMGVAGKLCILGTPELQSLLIGVNWGSFVLLQNGSRSINGHGHSGMSPESWNPGCDLCALRKRRCQEILGITLISSSRP